MIRYAGVRFVQSVATVFFVVLLVFVIARATGDPARNYLPEGSSPQAVESFDRLHGFDQPLGVQLEHFLHGALTLNFGDSLSYQRPAVSIVAEHYPATLELAAATMLVAVIIGIGVGVLAARKPGSGGDRAASLLSLGALSAPQFWIGLMGITLFAVHLGWLPTSGKGDWRYWVLPLFTLALNPTGILVHISRSAVMTALSSEYVKVARANGIPGYSILFRHALRNASLPILTVAGLLTASLVNGAILVESVFGWPGVGNLLVQAVERRDFALIEAIVLVTSAAIILLNLVIDLCYGWLDPRISYG